MAEQTAHTEPINAETPPSLPPMPTKPTLDQLMEWHQIVPYLPPDSPPAPPTVEVPYCWDEFRRRFAHIGPPKAQPPSVDLSPWPASWIFPTLTEDDMKRVFEDKTYQTLAHRFGYILQAVYCTVRKHKPKYYPNAREWLGRKPVWEQLRRFLETLDEVQRQLDDGKGPYSTHVSWQVRLLTGIIDKAGGNREPKFPPQFPGIPWGRLDMYYIMEGGRLQNALGAGLEEAHDNYIKYGCFIKGLPW